MNKSPLMLKTYFISDVKLSTIKKHKPEKGYTLSAQDIESTVKYLTSKKFPGIWQVRLYIEHKFKEKRNIPYTFSLNIAGFFEVVKTYPKEKATLLLKLNAPAMLYSAAREYIAIITGRAPWGEIMLPTTNFFPRPRVAAKRKAKLKKTKAAKRR